MRPSLVFAAAAGAAALLLAPVQADVYDLVFDLYHPPAAETCPGGCAPWNAVAPTNRSEQARIDSMWSLGHAPAGASSYCAMPAAAAGVDLCDGCTTDLVTNSYAGPWCYCKSPAAGHKHEQYCSPPMSVPEQVNLQIARQDIVVASFVTREARPPTSREAPSALFGTEKATSKRVQGLSHTYKALSEAENTTYVLHFIKFAGLVPLQTYHYKVQSGLPGAKESAWFTFRAPAASVSRIGIYGDMGHSHHNNMGNLKTDCEAGVIDFIVHMGDHAYDLAGAGDRRGDSYMNAYQPAIANCPWVPIIGNHEANDGDHYERYLNMTWGETLKGSQQQATVDTQSTATTALGDFLTKATLLGPGFHGNVPSNTSRYFSVSVGLVHIAGLDLNNLDSHQLAWLDADLAAVDRKSTPWVIVSSHFPLHHATVDQNLDASASYYKGEKPERWATSGHEFHATSCGARSDGEHVCEQTIGSWLSELQGGLEPLLQKHSVDIYDAGHVHDYNSNFPICYDAATGSSDICKTATGEQIKNFDNPKGTVHICEGNGGVPGVAGTNTVTLDCSAAATPWCRSHGTGGNYGRIIAYNATTLKYEHVENPTGKVTDEFVITKSSVVRTTTA